MTIAPICPTPIMQHETVQMALVDIPAFKAVAIS